MTSQEDKSVLSSHALIAFAFVEEAYAKTGDVVSGLLPLFAPLLAGKTGRQFDPKGFAQDVSARYGIPMSPLVAEGLVERLAEAKLLYLEDQDSRIYRVSAVKAADPGVDEKSIDGVLDDFVAFANKSLTPLGLAQAPEALKSGLLARLTSAEFLGAMERKQKNYFVGNKLTLKKPDEPEDNIDAESAVDVLSAEFALRSMEKGGASAELLVKIATGALIAEVILTLQAPGGENSLDDLSIFIDAPLLLDRLDLSSIELNEFAISLFELMEKAQVRMAVFSHTLDEMRGTILGPLDAMKRGEEPFGPLGSRIRLDSSQAAYARAVLDSLEEKLNDLHVTILDADELRTEAGLQRLSVDTEESLRNNVGPLHVGLERRIRDAASIASIMRLRPSRKARSIVEAGSVFVTRNPVVSNSSRSHLVFKGLIDRDEVPPAIMDRALAGYLWFVVGGNVGAITRKKLIANCSYVMSPKNDIISKVRQYLTEVDSGKAEMFSALLLDNRAQRCLVHSTLGFPSAVTASNVDAILQEVRESVAGELLERAAQREAEMAESHQAELSALTDAQRDAALEYENAALVDRQRAKSLIDEQARIASERAIELRETRDRIVLMEAEGRQDVDRRVGKAVSWARVSKKVVAGLLVIVYLAAVWVTYDLSPDLGVWKKVVAALVALSGFWFVPQLVFRLLGGLIWKWRFGKAVDTLGLRSNIDEFEVDVDKETAVRKDGRLSNKVDEVN